ncbi:MAG TPA: hypothetical protein VIW25_13150 [Nitrososphaeraceae archaeon]
MLVIECLWKSSVLHSTTIAAALVSSARLTPPYQINNSQPSASPVIQMIKAFQTLQPAAAQSQQHRLVFSTVIDLKARV